MRLEEQGVIQTWGSHLEVCKKTVWSGGVSNKRGIGGGNTEMGAQAQRTSIGRERLVCGHSHDAGRVGHHLRHCSGTRRLASIASLAFAPT